MQGAVQISRFSAVELLCPASLRSGFAVRKASLTSARACLRTTCTLQHDKPKSLRFDGTVGDVGLARRILESRLQSPPSSQGSDTQEGRFPDEQETRTTSGNFAETANLTCSVVEPPVGSSAEEPSQWWQRFFPKLGPRMRGLILLNMLTLLYGSNVTVIKEAQFGLDPETFLAGRFLAAAIAFSPFLKAGWKDPHVRKAGLELGMWASMAYLAQGIGLLTTEAGRASFIGTFTVIEVPIIAGLFGVKIPPITWASAAAAIAGVGLLESSAGASSLTGDLFTIFSALVFGVHILRSEHHSKHVDQNAALPLISLQLAVIAAASSAYIGVSYLTGHPVEGVNSLLAQDWSSVQQWPWWQMVYTGVISTAFCLWVEVVSLRDVSAAEAAMVYTLEPLYGAGFAWVLLGERWGATGWMGAALILGGSLTMQLFGQVQDLPSDEVEIKPPSGPSVLTALAGMAAVALLLAATTLSAPDGQAREFMQLENLLGDSVGATIEIDNLAAFLRVYALVKNDVEIAAEEAPPVVA